MLFARIAFPKDLLDIWKLAKLRWLCISAVAAVGGYAAGAASFAIELSCEWIL